MSKPDFSGVVAKLSRSDEHLENLSAEINSYLARRPVRYTPEAISGRAATYGFRVEFSEQPPLERWSTIVGDWAHNARSALDHAVWQLTSINGRASERTQFPIATTLGDWRRSGRQIDGTSSEQRAVIDEVQPYHRGDQAMHHPLAHLRRLSNTDKHRLLHASVMRLADAKPDLEVVGLDHGQAAALSFTVGLDVVEGAYMLFAELSPADPEPDIALRGTIDVGVYFGDPPLQGADLQRIGLSVREICSRLSAGGREPSSAT